ncbi:hypothetical protein RHMOL_Rhmol04G0343300 [Rhododendron molle]|uniref:Uncharacterized protein n=1 Tax=Rhododendron molle TaxID=49168 RepID=A0ACC0P7T7_RHOML|nr:hypothetical protein RHMOL_Rhmol04G0343300 [Rhododendron molle]
MPSKSGVVEIWGSFNGVLLVHIDEELCLWNPSIKMYQKISRPRCTRSWIKYGLGYDSINDDFKVVAAVPPTSDVPSTVRVFSSKLSSWKSVRDFGYSCCLYGRGSVLNGAPHWFARGITDIDACYFRIACFDVMEEKFKELPTPIYEVETNFFKVVNAMDHRRDLLNLPDDVLWRIFGSLPYSSQLRAQAVSRRWCPAILLLSTCQHPLALEVDYRAPDHTVTELKSPCKSKSRVSVMGSFNGVVLLYIDDEELCLWNPSTRMYQKLSPPPKCPKYQDENMTYGLGYDSVSDDFKVVRAVVSPSTKVPTPVYVFTSKLSSWKRIEDFGNSCFGRAPGAVMDGAPHWVVNFDRDTYFGIVCFDATEEKFKELPMPNCVDVNSCIDLGVLGGWLCVVDHSWGSHSDVLVMKKYGVKESWTKLFVLPSEPGEFYFPPFCRIYTMLLYTKDGEVVMVLNSEKLMIFNPKQNRYKQIEIPLDCEWFTATFYLESLVSPRDCNGLIT